MGAMNHHSAMLNPNYCAQVKREEIGCVVLAAYA